MASCRSCNRINVLLQSDIVYIIWLKRRVSKNMYGKNAQPEGLPGKMSTICGHNNLRASMSQAMEVEMGKDRNKLRTG
jgi:hypothetical protein